MPEIKRGFEYNRPKEERFSKPSLLDIVRINGRWAQVVGHIDVIKYLDDGSASHINWKNFKLTKQWENLPVKLVKNQEPFTDQELQNIRWGSEQKEHPKLKEEVSVFGEFEEIKDIN